MNAKRGFMMPTLRLGLTAWLDSLDFLNTLDVDYIVPGVDGPICNKDYIPKHRCLYPGMGHCRGRGYSEGLEQERLCGEDQLSGPFPYGYRSGEFRSL